LSLHSHQFHRHRLKSLLRGGRDLMILDEPSSGLDAEAEYELLMLAGGTFGLQAKGFATAEVLTADG
jgi:ABC-type Mn2+/Zn2+ transport system ATPase subunit